MSLIGRARPSQWHKALFVARAGEVPVRGRTTAVLPQGPLLPLPAEGTATPWCGLVLTWWGE